MKSGQSRPITSIKPLAPENRLSFYCYRGDIPPKIIQISPHWQSLSPFVFFLRSAHDWSTIWPYLNAIAREKQLTLWCRGVHVFECVRACVCVCVRGNIRRSLNSGTKIVGYSIVINLGKNWPCVSFFREVGANLDGIIILWKYYT